MIPRRLAALAVIGLLFAACSAGPGTGGELQATQWVLHSIDQGGSLAIVPETLFADAQFDAHRVSGTSGCNQYDALVQAGARTVLVSKPKVTLMACDEATMTFEQQYLSLLQAARFYSARSDTLTVWNGDRTTILVFDAAPRNPLLGRWEVDSFATTPSTVSVPIAGTSLDVVFGIASVGGSAGCNTFDGTYGTNGNVVRIGRLATTRLACAQDVMDQETAFLAALQGAALIDYRGTTVLLTDIKGAIQVALTRPAAEAEASASPSPTQAAASPNASAAPTATPTATPTARPTPTPSPTPTPTPTATPTAAPTAAPTAKPSGTPKPSVAPSGSPGIPPTASCQLTSSTSVAVATIVYPGAWYTVTSPAGLVCQYFDPKPITVPSDPTTLKTAVMARNVATSYADAVAAATNPTNWTVRQTSASDVGGVPVTCVNAVALTTASGLPVGTGSFECLANVGAAGTVGIFTIGTPADPTFQADSAVVGLMTEASTFNASR